MAAASAASETESRPLAVLSDKLQEKRLMVVSDLDFTMVDHNDPSHDALIKFNLLWAAEFAQDSILVFSTGRSPSKFQDLKGQVPLLTPDVLIMSVGTEIMYGESLEADKGWEEVLNEGWDRSAVVEEAKHFPQLRFQEESEQRPHKVSWFIDDQSQAQAAIDGISERLKSRGVRFKLIYSGGHAVDVLPEGAGKGRALEYLLRKLEEEGRKPAFTLACGDSGNDIELFTVEAAHGVIVGNAMSELVQWYERQEKKAHIFRATERCAGGILQALQHYGAPPPPPEGAGLIAKTGAPKAASASAAYTEVVEAYLWLRLWADGTLENTEENLGKLGRALGEDFVRIGAQGLSLDAGGLLDALRADHGRARGRGHMAWVDKLKVTTLAPDLFLARYTAEQRNTGGELNDIRLGSILFRSKAGTPNGLEWLHCQETLAAGSVHH